MEKDNPPHLVTPTSVKAIISKIETAQLIRTQEDISTQLSDILDNVNSAINRFQKEMGYDLKEKIKPHQPEQKGRKRFILLEKIASFSKDAKAKEKHLYELLDWLGDWGDSLTCEMASRRNLEEEEALNEWIEVMEKVLPLSLMATKGGIESLVSLCSSLIEEQKKKALTSRHNFWQEWQQKSAQKSPESPQPLSPEQMLQDKNTTCMKVSEVKSMLQELLDSTMFKKGEVKAIRYMSTVLENLNKALTLQHRENKSLETKYKYMQVEMSKELSTQRLYFQKSIQVLESQKAALQKQFEILGEKYRDLLLIKQALEYQLKKAQIARGLERPAELTALEELQQKLYQEGPLFSALSPTPPTQAWDSDTTPSAQEPLSTMAMKSTAADAFTEHPEPELLHSEALQLPTQWEEPGAEAPDHEGKDQGEDHFREKEAIQSKSDPQKCPSPESSRRVLLETSFHMEHWKEDLSWEARRQQWLQEEEMWLQRQKKWALLEQEHQEKARQWEAEAAARQQWQRLSPPEEKSSPRKGDSEKLIFTTTTRWRNLVKTEQAWAPPQGRTQSARPSRRSHLPMPKHTQQPGQRNQKTLSSAELGQIPQACQASAKPKKCASFPVTGLYIQRVARPSPQKDPESPQDTMYHIDMAAQMKNLQTLGGLESELALPHHQRSKALELTVIAMKLSILRLQHLFQKYIHYRHFQSLRQEVIKHIGSTPQTKVTYKKRDLYVFLENIDRQQSIRLQAWRDKQKEVEERLQECLHKMVTMFLLLREECNVHLNIPVTGTTGTSARPGKCKSPPVLLQRVRSSASTNKQSSMPKHRESTPLWVSSTQQENQMEAIWKADVASSSYPIERKVLLTSLPWDHLGGYPDIPRLLAVERPSYHRGMLSFETRSSSASVIQRKVSQEPSEEPPGLVRKMSSQSLPESL
ncbi:protein FAM186B [Meriones unguiculatus]|uniref:protein FAM186B n=1 Tax=Meriones unguiculatus TaxID=10047 RepID=UPI000B4FCF26|nr:protein FAM186B [Meriones unguiculatus]